ncbi:MAG: SMI1/KNR4 family protein [Tabrizicola sp.]|jgi:hypothetical protein|nr:SMI1/KNR4 family protein [Tabrizicola sp.]
MTPDMIAAAEEAWGTPLPDWIRSLALACNRSSQSKVAAQLDRSPALISTVLRKKYAGSYDRIEERVRGLLMDGRVDCPEMGQLPTHECQDWREKARVFAVGNPRRTRMYRACHRCPIFTKEGGE